MPRPIWTWVLDGCATRAFGGRELTLARSRRLTVRLDGTPDAQFTLDATSDEAADIVALATDLVIYRNGVKQFRGRIAPEQGTLSPRSRLIQFSAIGYRGLLNTRLMRAATGGGPALTFTGVDQAQIAWQLIDDAQDRPGGDWGITEGIGTTSGVLRDRTDWQPGKPIGDCVTELLNTDDGGDWEISPDLELNRWFPTRGENRGVLDYGGVLAQVDRTLQPADFGNAGIITGSAETIPATFEIAGIGTDPRGRWEIAEAFPSVVLQSTLDDRAAWLAAESGILRPVHSVRFRPGRWEGPDAVWVGDVVTLAVNRGRFTVNLPHRVAELTFTLSDNGVETVTAGLLATEDDS